MTKDEIQIFIEEMADFGDDWEPEDVERVYGDKSLEEALDARRGDMSILANILGTILNR